MRGPAVETYLGSESDTAAPGRPEDVAAAVREYVTAVRAYLAEIQRNGASGREVNETHSDQIDRLIRRLFELSEQRFFAEGGDGSSEVCVVAVGGYARREMSLHSDVDILFLYHGALTPHVTAVAQQVQYWLWDAQIQVGGATRTIAETIKLARKDTSVCTAVLAPRFLVGSGVLFHRFNQALQYQLLAKPERFIADLVVATQERHASYGDSLYLLQPNIKESAGGLRDYHASYWTMQATGSSARGKNDFLHLGLLTEEEAVAYMDALDFLWRLRNELHLVSGRKHDQMSFELQEQIAASFGYDVDDESEELPVERFMRDYYIHARNVMSYSSLIMEQCVARVRQKPRRRRIEPVERGLRIAQGQLEIPHVRQIREDPMLMLDVFTVAQKHDVPLTRKARRLVRENLQLIDEEFRTSPKAVETFIGLLSAERRVTRTLTAMNEVGVLERFLPEWAHIVCRWQHVMYHTYTVDVHSIFLIEELRRLTKGDYASELPDLTELMAGVEDPIAIYLGCLFHDIGKGFGGNHSSKGAVRTRTCLERMGLDSELVERVVFIVEQHLHMSHLAQRRDLSDPKLVVDFARIVGDRTNLRNLYLTTVADVRASSKTAWTDWKGRLLRELFERTSEFLEAGGGDLEKALDLAERRFETRQAAAAAELREEGIAEGDIQLYFETMPRRYFTAHLPPQIARHARLVLDFHGDKTLVTTVREMRGGFSELILCARDEHGLYSNVAGALRAHNLNILGSHVYTTRSGLALEVYRLTTPSGGDAERRIAWDEFEASVSRVVNGEIAVAELLRRRGRPIGRTSTPSRQPVKVQITNEESDFYTIVDVSANDRVGLLHDLTRVIAEHGYEIYISKAGTVLDQVADTFYLKDGERRKITDEAAITKLQRDMIAAAGGEGVG